MKVVDGNLAKANKYFRYFPELKLGVIKKKPALNNHGALARG